MSKPLASVAFILFVGCASTTGSCTAIASAWILPRAHMTNQIPTGFVVPQLRGRILPQDQDAWSGPAPVRLEIQRNGRSLGEIAVAPDGTFSSVLPDGSYCFHVTSQHFQGYEGTIQVTSDAPKDAEVVIRVEYGA